MAKTAKAHVTYTYKKHDYTFRFEYRYSFWHGFRAYIVEAPDYRGRSEDLHRTHRYRDGNQFYICWNTKIRKREEMDAVAELWSKATTMYIANGGASIDDYVSAILNADH